MANRMGSAAIQASWADWAIRVDASQRAPVGGADSAAGPDEGALVEACLEGRLEAFDTIVERHRREVYRLCYRFAGNHEDASDLSQEVFLRAFRGLRRFRGASSLRTWLHRIGVNVCLSRSGLRKPATEAVDAVQHPDSRAEDPVAGLIRAEERARVRAALERLPRKQRAALVLRAYHDLSNQEIARVLCSSEGAVKANVFQALRNLKRLLTGGRRGA
jgi:RNA polymerase sigma-70 factor, ECF subfamily